MMTKKTETRILSSDNKTSLHVVEWIPDGEIKGTLEIVHGMVEFIDRYDRFGRFISENGYAVIGYDQLGHGETAPDEDSLGYIGSPHPELLLIEDVQKVREYIDEKYGSCRHYILGHSMGSFVVEAYLMKYGKGLDGAIISGTGYQSTAKLDAGLLLTDIISLFRKDTYRSGFINDMALGSYNKSFEPARTKNDWLTKDEEIVDRYCEHPWDNFVFTLNGYRAVFRLMKLAGNRKGMKNIPKDLKIFLCLWIIF